MLKVGFSRADITPPLGSFMAGYFYARYAKGILDPIYINALALDDGVERAVIISADFEGIRMKYADKIRNNIAERTGVKKEFIFLTALHQHTAIGLDDGEITKTSNNVMEDTAYLDFLYRKFVDIAVMALDDATEAIWSYAEKEADEQVSFVRRYLMKDGLVCTNPYEKEHLIVKPSEEPDNTVRLIRFKREGKPDIAFVNFQTHPDIIGGEYFSADWCGFLRQNVENDIENVHCFFINGFQGDTNHVNFMGEKKRGFKRSVEIGRILADAVIDIWDKTECENEFSLHSGNALVFNRTNTKNEEHYDECLSLVEEVEKGEKRSAATPSGISYVEAIRVVNLKTVEPMYQKIPIATLQMGRFLLVGIGCEPFTNYARAVREAYPDKIVYSACCTNGYEGYLPTKVAYAYGGYEVITSPFSESVEDECLLSIKSLIK